MYTRPKRRAIMGMMLAVPICACVWLYRLSPPPVPLARVDRDAHNWGIVQPGSELSTSFVIQNRGGATLDLGEPTATCGCTKPILPERSIEPGRQVALKVGFRAPSEPGAVAHRLSIPTNDPSQPILEFGLFAQAWTGIKATPQAVNLGRPTPGSLVESTVQVSSLNGTKFSITYIWCDVPGLEAEAETPATELLAHRVHLRYRAAEKLGPVRGIVRVVTNYIEAPYIEIPIAGIVEGSLTILPSSLSIGREEIGKVVRRKMIIHSKHPDSKLAISSIDGVAPTEVIGYSFNTLNDGRLVLDVSLRFPKGDGSLQGGLLLAISTPSFIEYSIPLSITGWTPPFPTDP